MQTISLLKENKDLSEKLLKYNCKVTYNNKVLYEGIYNENIDTKKYNKSQIVYDFNINDNHILFLGEENKDIEKLYKIFENKEFKDIFNDAKLFNKSMNLANNLPLYNFDKELFESDIKSSIRKYGMNLQKIYENLNINNISLVDEKLKVNSKSKVNVTPDNNLSEQSINEKYANDWQFFNILTTDVKLEEKQLENMFNNLTDQEIKVWIKEIQDCYVGCEGEDEANKMKDESDLAKFYYKYPVTT